MNRKLLLYIFICIGGTAYPSTPMEEEGRNRWTGIENIYQTNLWLNTHNAAAYQSVDIDMISEVNVFFGKNNGQFINYNESDNSMTAGAEVKSFYRLKPGIMLRGEIGYSYMKGKNMGGSFLMDPYNAPFDLSDCDEHNKGEKRKEIYHIQGGFSAVLNKNWAIGTDCNYTASNYTKQKDLRHTNHLMDISISPAIIYSPNRHVSIGADYTYRKRNEGIILKTYGTTDQIYHSLVNFGGFWGVVEEFGKNGYTKGNEDKPLLDKYHSGDIQISWNITPCIQLMNEIEYKHRKGYYGVESPNTIVYTRHAADIWKYNALAKITGHKSIHLMGIGFNKEILNNYERIYKYDNEGGGLQNIGYYGEMNTSNKKNWNMEAYYATHLGLKGDLPTWIIRGQYNLYKRIVNASYYPYYRNSNMNRHSFCLKGEYNIYRHKDAIQISAATQYSFGNGNKGSDGYYATPSESRITPQTVDYMLNEEYEYLTARQMRYEVAAQYSRSLRNTNIKGFCSASYSVAHAFQLSYLGSKPYHSLLLSVGCRF